MSVTESYKIFKFSFDEELAVRFALEARDNELRIRSLDAARWKTNMREYHEEQVAAVRSAMGIMCAPQSHEDKLSALEGENLQTVVVELSTMRRLLADGAFGSVGMLKRLDGIDAALLFLKNPK